MKTFFKQNTKIKTTGTAKIITRHYKHTCNQKRNPRIRARPLRWPLFIIWSARSEVKINKENALITTVTSKSGLFKNKQHSFSTTYCSAPTTEVLCGCFLCYYGGPKNSLVTKRKVRKTFSWEINILLSKRMNLVRVFIYHSIMTMISSYKLKVPKNQLLS